MAMKITDVCVDAARTFGKKLFLVDVRPAYEYKDGHRTENITGYRYDVCLPERKMEKISVMIEGPAQLEAPDGYYDVSFDGLEVFIYWTRDGHALGARARSVKVLKENT